MYLNALSSISRRVRMPETLERHLVCVLVIVDRVIKQVFKELKEQEYACYMYTMDVGVG